MKKLILALALTPALAAAQPMHRPRVPVVPPTKAEDLAPPKPSDDVLLLQGALSAMQQQRNNFADQAAIAEGRAKITAQKIADLEKQIKDLKDAQQEREASPSDGSSGPQSGLRQEGGSPTVGGPGVQSSGRQDGDTAQEKEKVQGR